MYQLFYTDSLTVTGTDSLTVTGMPPPRFRSCHSNPTASRASISSCVRGLRVRCSLSRPVTRSRQRRRWSMTKLPNPSGTSPLYCETRQCPCSIWYAASCLTRSSKGTCSYLANLNRNPSSVSRWIRCGVMAVVDLPCRRNR